MTYSLYNILLRGNKLRLFYVVVLLIFIFFFLILFLLPTTPRTRLNHQDSFTTKYQGYHKTYLGDNGARESIMSVAPKCSSRCSARRESHAERQTFNTRSTRHIKANSGSARDKSWVTLARGILHLPTGPRGARVGPPPDAPATEETLKSSKEPLLCLRQSTITGTWRRGGSKPAAIVIIITSACKSTTITAIPITATNADA